MIYRLCHAKYPSAMPDTPQRPSLVALFLGFLTVGLFGFGGVLPWARRMVVEQKRWLSAAEFTDLLGLCQFLPGGNIMNVTVALGARFHGIPGAVIAFVGLMAAPVACVIALGVIYGRYAQVPTVRHAFAGLAAAAAAMVLANALRISAPLRSRPVGLAVAIATFVAIAVLRLPLALVLVAMTALSTLLMWRLAR
jgi:chromate transporter